MIRPGTSVNRNTNTSKLGKNLNFSLTHQRKKLPSFEFFLKRNDWVGAVSILELEKYNNKLDVHLWIAYCYFHLGEYKKAVQIYDQLLRAPDHDKNYHCYKAVCLYALCNFDLAKNEALKAPESPLKIRLMYQISQKKQDDATLMNYHHKLTDSEEDQLCVGAIHYFRGHFDDCIELYKKILQQQKKNVALNVYLALCYYRQEFFEVSQEIVEAYLSKHPKSLFAVNLQACNVF